MVRATYTFTLFQKLSQYAVYSRNERSSYCRITLTIHPKKIPLAFRLEENLKILLIIVIQEEWHYRIFSSSGREVSYWQHLIIQNLRPSLSRGHSLMSVYPYSINATSFGALIFMESCCPFQLIPSLSHILSFENRLWRIFLTIYITMMTYAYSNNCSLTRPSQHSSIGEKKYNENISYLAIFNTKGTYKVLLCIMGNWKNTLEFQKKSSE